jgi:hypothetical protein
VLPKRTSLIPVAQKRLMSYSSRLTKCKNEGQRQKMAAKSRQITGHKLRDAFGQLF